MYFLTGHRRTFVSDSRVGHIIHISQPLWCAGPPSFILALEESPLMLRVSNLSFEYGLFRS